MLAFVPAAVPTGDQSAEVHALAEPDRAAETYVHPSPALSHAQSMAAGAGIGSLDGTVLAAVLLVFHDDEMWGACCARCLRVVGDVHAAMCSQSGPVLPFWAVVRPIEQLTRSPAPA